jgi:hypothetical protein
MEDILRLSISEQQKRRIRKLYDEKYYLLGFKKDENEITISGSTNSIYKIKIHSNYMMCNCMDCKINCNKSIYCKHICFVFIKILQSKDYSNFFTNFFISEKDISSLHDILKAMFEKDMSIFNSTSDERNLNDDCPVCYETLSTDLSKCPECKNAIHTDCIQKWLKFNPTCVYCRSNSWRLFT